MIPSALRDIDRICEDNDALRAEVLKLSTRIDELEKHLFVEKWVSRVLRDRIANLESGAIVAQLAAAITGDDTGIDCGDTRWHPAINDARELRARLSDLTTWRPMSTAPRNTRILVMVRTPYPLRKVRIAELSMATRDEVPIAWLPLPEPPKEEL